jgi:hypothetical protein
MIGAAGGLVGDQGHVVSGTTRYLATGFPFVWKSQLWFPLLVGSGTVAVGELRLRIAPVRARGDWSDGLAAIAAVLAIYAVTALVRGRPLGPGTVLVAGLAVLVWRALGASTPGAVCGLIAAIVGTTTEIVMVAAGVFEYADDADALAGVAPWLPALYFAFGVVAARLGELLAPQARPG